MSRAFRWYIVTLVFGFVALGVSGLLIYQGQERAFRRQIDGNLQSIAELKSSQIASWRSKLLLEGAEIAARPLLNALLRQKLNNRTDASDDAVLANELDAIRRNDDYKDVLLLDKYGNVRLSAAGNNESAHYRDYIRQPLETLTPTITDLHADELAGTKHISVLVPVIGDDGEPQGVLVLVTDAQEYLFPYIQSWPVPSDTAETLLVRRDGDDVLYLNELRHMTGTALSLRIPITAERLPAALAVLGEQGIVIGKDYRGKEVVAALLPVPDSPWQLVAKIDTEEAFASWRTFSTLLLLLLSGAATLFAVVALNVRQYRRRQRIQQLYEAEMARRDHDARYSVTLNSIGEGVIATDAAGKVTLLNPMAEKLTGWTDADARGRPLAEVFKLIDEPSRTPVEDPVSRVLHTQSIVHLANHTILVDRHGQEHPIADAASPIRSEQGILLGVALVFRDQSAERAAKHALEQREAQLRAMVAAIPDLIFRIDHRYRFQDSLTVDLSRLLLPPERFLGRSIFDVLPAAIAEDAAEAIDRALSSGTVQTIEYTLEMSGFPHWYEQRIAPVSDVEVLAITRDVSDIRQNEALMQSRLNLLEYAADHSLNELLIRTLDEVGELVNSPVGFYHFVETDQRTLSLQAWSTRTQRDFCTAKSHSLHYPIANAGVWADAVRVRKPVVHNDYASLPNRRGMPEGHATLIREIVVPIMRHDCVVAILGVGNKPTDYTAADIKAVSYMADVAWEIAERKRIEEAQASLQVQLQQAQKLETIGQLAGGIAHDFNNMLAVILMRAEMALLTVEPDSPLYRNLSEIYSTGQRSAELTRKLLGFARKQMIAPTMLDLNETVSGMLRMLQRLIGEEINLQWQPGEKLRTIKMDPSQVDQILVNLCINARDAIDSSGSIRIETANTWLDETYVALHPPLAAGPYVLLAVSDDGTGMNPEVLRHIFEPFFTTKEVGKGTGLGLATVYGIVQQNHGHIVVYSELGIGTTFKIYLPVATDEPLASVAYSAPALQVSKGEIVLLVEDEPLVLEMGAESLRKLGYTVFTADTPSAALAIASQNLYEFDLLVSDIIMPELNGKELAQRIAGLQPAIKCLFISGYPSEFIAQRGVLEPGVSFLSKPFTLHQLAAAVRKALDAPGPADAP